REAAVGRHHGLAELHELEKLGDMECLVKAHKHSLEALEIGDTIDGSRHRQEHVDGRHIRRRAAAFDRRCIDFSLTLELGSGSGHLYNLPDSHMTLLVAVKY